MAIRQGSGARFLAAPDAYVHAKGLAVSGHDLSDVPIAPYPQGFASQDASQSEIGGHAGGFEARLLPRAMLEVGNVLGQAPRGSHDECPGQLCGRHW